MFLYGVIVCLFFSGLVSRANSADLDDESVEVPNLNILRRTRVNQVKPIWASQSESRIAKSVDEASTYINGGLNYAQYAENPPWNYGNQPLGQGNANAGQSPTGYYPTGAEQGQQQGFQSQGVTGAAENEQLKPTAPGSYPQKPQPGYPQLPQQGVSRPGSGSVAQPTYSQPGLPQRPQTGTPQPGQINQSGASQRPQPSQPVQPSTPGYPQKPQTGQTQRPQPGQPTQPAQPVQPGYPQRPKPGQSVLPQEPQTGFPQQPQRPRPPSPQPTRPIQTGYPQRPQPGFPQPVQPTQRPQPGPSQSGKPTQTGYPQRPQPPQQPQQPQPVSPQPARPVQPGYPQRPVPSQPGIPLPPSSQPSYPQRPTDNQIYPGSPFYPQIQPGLTGPPEGELGSVDQLLQYCKEPRGQFAIDTSCSKFVNCWDDVAVEQECGANLVFNEDKKYCDFPENVDCGSRPTSQTNPPTDGNCPSPFASYRSSTDCGEFIVCAHGTPYKFHCPADLAYNNDLGVCDYAYRVDCNGIPLLPFEETSDNYDYQTDLDNSQNENNESPNENYNGGLGIFGNKPYGRAKISEEETSRHDSLKNDEEES